MKIIKTSIVLLSILGALAFTVPASAATIYLSCDDYSITGWCTGSLWVSSGLGAGQVMVLNSVTKNGLSITGLPSQITPPPPGQAHTITTGQVGIYFAAKGSGQIAYDVVQNGKTIDTCNFYLNAATAEYVSLSVTGLCEAEFASPVNVIGANTVDIGIN